MTEFPNNPNARTEGSRAAENELAQFNADMTARVYSLRNQISQGVQLQFIEPTQVIAQLYSKIHDAINLNMAIGGQCCQAIQDKVCAFLDNILDCGKTCLNGKQAKCDKHARRLQAKSGSPAPSAPPPRSAPPPAPAAPPQNGSAPVGSAGGPVQNCPAATGLPPEPFPDPPSKEELAGLLVPFPDGTGAIDCEQLPAEFWDWQNPLKWWLSLAPTPVSRVQMTAVRWDGTNIGPAGILFLNVGMALDLDALVSLLSEFGLPKDAYCALSLDEAWQANSEAFGGMLTGAMWDYFCIPHPSVTVQMTPLPKTALPSVPLPATDAPSCKPANVPENGVYVPISTPKDAGVPFGEPVQISMPTLPNPLQALFDRLRMPTNAEICGVLDPVYQYLGVPQNMRLPCVTLEQARAAFYQAMNLPD
jgi:hypothetical protein